MNKPGQVIALSTFVGFKLEMNRAQMFKESSGRVESFGTEITWERLRPDVLLTDVDAEKGTVSKYFATLKGKNASKKTRNNHLDLFSLNP